MHKLAPLVFAILLIACQSAQPQPPTSEATPSLPVDSVADSIPAGLQKLALAYPQSIHHISRNALYFANGDSIVYNFQLPEMPFDSLLNRADLHAQMQQEYPVGEQYNIPAINSDPGRLRHEAFFRRMYGATRTEVESRLTTITWLPGTDWQRRLRVTTINNVHLHLQAVSDSLLQHPELLRYVNHPAGSYNWRPIAGTHRLSSHSFGIAIDINTSVSDYWRWNLPASRTGTLTYRNRIPLEIVRIFESQGFIWGGKWYHYDTMHFEYRPELLP